jgi:AGCS family alanine or glycine:cation symporter
MAGGMKRIGHFAAKVVPIMALAYIIIAIILIIGNIALVPSVIGTIFASAFGGHAVFGGLLGSAMAWGVRRAVYSSEAGFGTGASAAGAAEVSHPAKHGLAQALTVFIDTLGVCTATAFIILMTGMYSVEGPDGSILYGAKAIIDAQIEAGTGYTQMAVSTMFGAGFGQAFIAIAVFFFAFTTNLAFGYYCKPGAAYLCRNEKILKPLLLAFVALQCVAIFFGSIYDSALTWGIADIGTGSATWLNLIALLCLLKPAKRVWADFVRQRKAGLDPVFVPQDIGITGEEAVLWNKIAAESYPEQLAAKKATLG